MTGQPDLPGEAPHVDITQRDLALTDIEQRYLKQDGYDNEGNLSHAKPGDTLRELIHEIRQTRTAIRLAEATFVSKTDLEERLKAAGADVTRLRHQAARRLWGAVAAVVAALALMGAGGIYAGWVFHHQQQESNYDRCVQSNTFRQGDRDLWNKVLSLSTQPRTPQEQQVTEKFKAFLDQHDKLFVCKKP